jgi:6-pyruvoyltetrahydropterin/6-carboxytetrahydropterin synthase
VRLRTRIAKTWSFDAAHQLPNHDGKCRYLHGHTYRLTVVVSGEPHELDGSAKEGMVLDFADLDAIWQDLKPELDHRYLNETVPVPITTSEHLAAYAFGFFEGRVAPTAQVERVRISETPTTYAEVTNDVVA